MYVYTCYIHAQCRNPYWYDRDVSTVGDSIGHYCDHIWAVHKEQRTESTGAYLLCMQIIITLSFNIHVHVSSYGLLCTL